MKRIAALVLTVVLALASVVSAEEILNGAGATFPYPVYSAWANEYNKVSGMKLNYQSIGSGGGIKQITERTVDFGASDKPLKPEELAKSNLLQYPAVIGGVVLVVNMPGVKAGELKLDSNSLCKIYLGEIKNWIPLAAAALELGMKMTLIDYVPCYRSEAGTGTAMAFAYWAA